MNARASNPKLPRLKHSAFDPPDARGLDSSTCHAYVCDAYMRYMIVWATRSRQQLGQAAYHASHITDARIVYPVRQRIAV